MRSVNITGIPQEKFDSWTHVLIGAILYGPKEDGYCGIEPGSEEDRALMDWSTSKGVERTNAILCVERKLRRLLRENELLSKPVNASVITGETERDPESGNLRSKLSKIH